MIIAGVINGLQMQVFNFFYGKISVQLNDWENHRTDSIYENYLIGKTFFFKMINSFVTFVYIGYFKKYDEAVGYCTGSWQAYILKLKTTDPTAQDIANNWYLTVPPGQNVTIPCCLTEDAATQCKNAGVDTALCQLSSIYNMYGQDYRGDCYGELAFQLFIIFGMMIVVNNAIEIAGPVIGKFMQNRSQTKDPNAHKKGKDAEGLEMAEAKQKDPETPMGPINEKLAKITDPSKQSDAENEFEYTQYEGTFSDYDELIIQYGFVVLFVVVFPLAPLFALLNNIIEFRLDASKLMSFTRRPHPRGTYDMGTWFPILNFISWVMVVSNTALLVFCSTVAEHLIPDYRWITFVVVEHILIGTKLMIEFFIPDVPREVEDRLARQEVIKSTLIDPNY